MTLRKETMPRYEHKCLKDICEFLFEVTYSITEEPNINCPKCASPTQRQISANVMFETPVDVESVSYTHLRAHET